MLGKKLGSMKRLAKKVKAKRDAYDSDSSNHEYLLGDYIEGVDSHTMPPIGTFAVYVGDDRQRFVVPTGYLSHPLFKILLEKAYDEFGFEQRNGLVVPCSILAFQEVMSAIQFCHGKFEFGELVEEFI